MINFFNKHRSKTAKIFGIVLFTLLMFINLQIISNPNKNGDIDLFGLKLALFTPSAYAEPTQEDCDAICISRPDRICIYMIGHGYCVGDKNWL